jgi:hypothetical protein
MARPGRRLEQPADRGCPDGQDHSGRELPVELCRRKRRRLRRRLRHDLDRERDRQRHKLLAATNKAGGKIQAWKTFTPTVKATKPATALEFQNGDSGSDNDNGLDAVSLTKR